MASTGQGGGVSRSRLIVALLALVSLLVAALVWQSIETASSNRAAATQVLKDYGRLAADEFTRRAMVEVGYGGYFAHITALRQAHESRAGILDGQPAADGGPAGGAGRLATMRFVIDVPSFEARFSNTVEPEVAGYVVDVASELAATEERPPLAIRHMQDDAGSRSYVFGVADGAVFGFEVDRSVLGERLQVLFAGEPLLPESLAHGAVGNDALYLEFRDDSDEVLFRSKSGFEPELVSVKTIDDGYSGIFMDHTVAVAIDASAADALIIGGLPTSRLPVLLATVLLTIALLIAAILQLRREYRLMQLRNNFVSEVSHELRTPLTQIRLFVETLLLGRFESGGDKRRALEIINRESQRLILLVDNVLRFSGEKDSVTPPSIAHGPLAPVVERVIEEFRPLADAAGSGINLEADGDVEARFDEDALRRILLNLLDNAIKYGPEGQPIRVSLQESTNGARLSVHDEGPGVPYADRDKVWDAYYRLDRERDGAIAGTGIGLSVVRDLVSRLGGKAWIEEGDGGTFVVELPGARP